MTQSPSVTAVRLLNAISLLECILPKGYAVPDPASGFLDSIPEAVGINFIPASLSYIAKYWQDPIGIDIIIIADVAESAKILFISTLKSMEPAKKKTLIQFLISSRIMSLI